jgi:hypothetical protein
MGAPRRWRRSQASGRRWEGERKAPVSDASDGGLPGVDVPTRVRRRVTGPDRPPHPDTDVLRLAHNDRRRAEAETCCRVLIDGPQEMLPSQPRAMSPPRGHAASC